MVILKYNNKMNIRLKEILEEKGISLTILAEKSEIEKGNLSSIANNKKNPTIGTLERIAIALNIEVWELFTPSVSKEELTALVDHRGRLYKASSIEELQKIIEEIKKEPV